MFDFEERTKSDNSCTELGRFRYESQKAMKPLSYVMLCSLTESHAGEDNCNPHRLDSVRGFHTRPRVLSPGGQIPFQRERHSNSAIERKARMESQR